MANIWEEFDNTIDTAELQKGIEEAKENQGNFKEVPHDTYVVGVEKMELVKSKNGHPMVSIWFVIEEGEFKNSKVFYNQVINNPFGIHNNNELLIAMGLECVNEQLEGEGQVFDTYSQYGQLLLDAAEEIEEYGLTFELEYGKGKGDFNTFKITDAFE